MGLDYDELSNQLINFDSGIRFAAIANNKGELVAGGQKENVEQILSGDNVKMSIHYALQKRDLYTNLAYKIGKEKSSITEYEKVTLISIPINSSDLLLISTEPRANYLSIVDFSLSIINSESD